jgi:hypothetical protein
VLSRVVQILVDVATRVDHDCPAGRLVADQIRRLRQTVEVVLREDHADPLPKSRKDTMFPPWAPTGNLKSA